MTPLTFRAKRAECLLVVASLLLSVNLPLSGCSGGGAVAKPKGDQAQVSGSVTYEGKPVTLDSSVVFYCKDEAATASGKVDTLGNYSLKAADPAVGIPVGRYNVMIRPPEAPMPKVGSPEYNDAMMGKVKKREAPRDIPAKFHAYETSKIILELKAGPQDLNFALDKL